MPLHIVTVVDTFPCLSETFIAREVEELTRQGAIVEVAALRGNAPYRLPSRPVGALRRGIVRTLARNPLRSLSLWRRAGQAAALAERARATPGTVLLAQFAWTPADVVRMASAWSGAPFAVRVHAWDVFAQRPGALRQRLDSAAAVLPCHAAAGESVRACGYPSERIKVVHHGLPLGQPEWDWAPPSPASRIVGIGRLVPKKGIGVLLDACALLARDAVPFSVEWIGGGPEEVRLKRYARALGLADRFRFAGPLSPGETLARLRGAGLLALPSLRMPDGDRDGIANVLLEAMAVGVPVVSTTAGSAGEVVRNGLNGWLVPPGDAAALANALRQGLDPATDRLAVSRAARATLERDFDLARNAAELLESLRGVQALSPNIRSLRSR